MLYSETTYTITVKDSEIINCELSSCITHSEQKEKDLYIIESK